MFPSKSITPTEDRRHSPLNRQRAAETRCYRAEHDRTGQGRTKAYKGVQRRTKAYKGVQRRTEVLRAAPKKPHSARAYPMDTAFISPTHSLKIIHIQRGYIFSRRRITPYIFYIYINLYTNNYSILFTSSKFLHSAFQCLHRPAMPSAPPRRHQPQGRIS